jgi:hypothetical protein
MLRGLQQKVASFGMSVPAVFGFSLMALWLAGCSTSKPAVSRNELEGWAHVVNAECRFSALMPVQPQKSVRHDAGIESLQFEADPDETRSFTVIYSAYPESLPYIWTFGTPWFFDVIQEAVLKESGGRLVESHDSEFDSHPGRDIQIEVQDKRVLIHERIIISENRMYQLMVTSTLGTDVASEKKVFFNSFRML